MKVTIPITFTKYTPGPVAPNRLVSVHDDRDGGFDFLGLEYTDGSIKVPFFQNESENEQICILEDGQNLLFNRDEDQFSLFLSDEYYNIIKNEYEFIFCDFYAGWEVGDAIHTFWYILEFDFGRFADQINLYENTPNDIKCSVNNSIAIDDELPNAEVETYEGVDLLCINKNGRKFYLFDKDDESWRCNGINIRFFANSCQDYGITGGSVPEDQPIARASVYINSRTCSVTEGVVSGEGRISITLFGYDYIAYFNVNGSGDMPVPISSLEFQEA